MTFTRDALQDVVATAPRRKAGKVGKTFLALFLASLVFALVGVVRNYLADSNPPAVAAAPEAPPLANPAPVIPDTGVCSAFPAADPAAALTYSPVTAWTKEGGTSLPLSDDAGPGFQDPYSWCFAHTAKGALFAAATYTGQYKDGAMTPGREIVLAQYMAADDAGRDSAIAQWAAAGSQPLAGGKAGNYTIPPAQFIGFHFVNYTPDQAVIEIASTWNDTLVALTVTLTRESGDWKVVLPANAQFPTRALIAPIDSTYFIKWAAAGAG